MDSLQKSTAPRRDKAPAAGAAIGFGKDDIAQRIALANARAQEFPQRLANIHKQLKAAKKARKNFKEAMKEIEDDLLKLFDTRFLTVYQSINNGKDISAFFKGGRNSTTVEKLEIRVPMGVTSLAGYVALTQRPLLIKDVYNKEELADIHPRLRWDSSFSEKRDLTFRSMVVVPIKDEIFLGLVQLINFKGDREFTRADIKCATMLAQVLAKEFRGEFQTTQGPYDYLVQQGKINSKDLQEVLTTTSLYGGSVSKRLMEDYKIKDDDIGKSLELYYCVPYMKFDKELQLPREFMENISLSYLRNNLWVPVFGDKEEVTVLLSDPSNYERVMEIQGLLNAKNYVFRVGLPEHILKYLNRESEEESGAGEGFDDVFRNLQGEAGIEIEEQEEESSDESVAATSAIIQLTNRIIIEAERQGGSDIHVEPGKERKPGSVRVRVDGVCRDLLSVPAEHVGPLIARIKVMSRLDIAEKRLPQDGKCKLKLRGRMLELRVATVPTVNGESAVLRILAAGNAMPMSKLMLSERNMHNLLEVSSRPHGLLLVVGPTGSGKTTTLHAVLGHLNQPDRKIWTAEDPVEITQPGLQQVQIQPKIGFTFANAMRAFLRADPDVILIGEMRDKETASIGVEASLTGHLVLSTLHTNSAPETVTRLLDLGLDPVNFSDALLGILAQRLMRTLCPHCKKPYRPEQRELEHLIQQYGKDQFDELGVDAKTVELMRASGCEACGNSGYKGRLGVHELLVGSNEIRGLIYNRAPLSALREQAARDGMRTLKQDAIAKIFMGLSDYEQLLRITAE